MEEKKIIELISRVSLKNEIFTDKNVVWHRIAHRLTTRYRLRIRTYWSLAASVAAVIFLVVGLGSRMEIKSGDNELNYSLSDGSTVHLEANSAIHYNRIGWLFERRVVLDGNASFDVVKHKGRFSVVADQGTISVLGTQFLILQQAANLHVACTEGSVEVQTEIGTKILQKGEQLDYDGSQMMITPILPEYLEFDNAQLTDVISQMAEIYNLTIMNQDVCNGRLFSGWVSTQNVDEAIEVIMKSCNIDYTLNGGILTIND